MATKRTGTFKPLAASLGSVLRVRTNKPRDYAEGPKLWKNFKQLRDTPLVEFQRIRICCPYCSARKKYCEGCDGSGYVCPTCTGARWLAQPRDEGPSVMVRCGDCGLDMSEGWQYDFSREVLSVERWLEEWATTNKAT